ncbi:MAG TPA: hypothetical protein VNW53_11755 [Phenylobacterium sp.]|uniref:hypothetical protein n=1 Tax=Phenylobacterium sp. TaxID=1871053 RepID=UPI002B890366|nr:hypothetical protein [Phenylobacterium sp.]HXA39668.1 hypothetical protein [Phenylobacterium sp.]
MTSKVPKSAFEALLDEICADYPQIAKAMASTLDTAEDDQRIAEAGGEEAGGQRQLGPDHVAVLKMFNKVTKVITALSEQIEDLKDEVSSLKRDDAKPMTKAMRQRGRVRELGDQFMAKAIVAQGAGRITASQVAVAEACINAGKVPPREIVVAVVGGAVG